MISASRVLLAPRQDVWRLVAEPFHLADWWPAYRGVRPDRRGLAPGARWQVVRSRTPGLLRRPGGEGLIVILRVVEGGELAWHDLAQRVEAGVRLADAGPGRTEATAFVEGSRLRLAVEGSLGLPRQALARLYELCQTAASLS